MNWLDITLFCLLGIGFVKGLFDGFIKQVVSLIALAASIFFCGKLGDYLEVYMKELGWFPPEGVEIMSVIIAFLLILLILSTTGILLKKIVAATPLGPIDNFVGGVFGLGVWALFLSILLNIIETIDRKSILIKEEVKKESILYEPLNEIIQTIYPHNLFTSKEENPLLPKFIKL